jgi:hypothetical protein
LACYLAVKMVLFLSLDSPIEFQSIRDFSLAATTSLANGRWPFKTTGVPFVSTSPAHGFDGALIRHLQEVIPDILQSYLLATNLDRTWYKAWHAWALANSEVVSHYAKSQSDQERLPDEVYRNHLVPSVRGASHSVLS